MKYIANLDNEVYFKNVFTDVEIFKGFVKDILGIEMNIIKVETEKVLPSKVSPIKFRMDLFAEDFENRTVVEIQKVDYDYTYDRFSHYFFANLVDLQKSSRTYSFEKEVYVIVVVTSAYKITEKNGRPIKDAVLVTDTNPRSLQGEMRDMHNHKMVILNTTNIKEDTPKLFKDWLDLIAESMKANQDLSKINQTNKAIAKAVHRAGLNDLSPEELAEAKELEMKSLARALLIDNSFNDGLEEGLEKGEQIGLEKGEQIGLQKGLEKERDKGIRKALKRGRLTMEEIAEDFEVSVEYIKQVVETTK